LSPETSAFKLQTLGKFPEEYKLHSEHGESLKTTTNGEVFQRAKEERLLLKILKNRCHSWIGHTVRHNEFVINILEGAMSGENAVGIPRLQ